ncbi:hypothetical protein MBLNU13_g01034t1 [Cladosporium sp. NU13]
MNSNFNSQQWQQQYPNPNQQYAQPSQHTSTGTLHHNYSSAAQLAPYESQFAQQDVSQPLHQGLMQQMPTQQTSQNTQLQQQPAYQHHVQGVCSDMPAHLAPLGPWTQIQPNAQWQTATNNATTTKTTTTTTTKSIEETRASQPQYASSSTALDFASLIQEAPQQQPALQQQQAFNYSQTMQSGNRQQTLSPPAIDYLQLTQNNPPQMQDTVNFSQLLQTAPPPQPQVSHAPPVVRTPITPTLAKSTNKTTTTKTTNVVGSTSRKEAAEKGKKELRHFDEEVSTQLKRSYDGICPYGYDYYAARQGYICGGGHHFFSHDDVEAMLKYGRYPFLEHVNGNEYHRQVTPPPGNGDGSGLEPLFWTTEQLSEMGSYPFAWLKNPGKTPRLKPMNPYKLDEFNRRLDAWRATRQGSGRF